VCSGQYKNGKNGVAGVVSVVSCSQVLYRKGLGTDPGLIRNLEFCTLASIALCVSFLAGRLKSGPLILPEFAGRGPGDCSLSILSQLHRRCYNEKKEVAMRTKDYELTEPEWQIMRVVWAHHPCTAPTVQEELAGKKKWSYSTVKTFMDRMVAKRLLSARRIRNFVLYSAAITTEQAQRREVARTLKRAFGGSFTAMMQSLLGSDKLSRKELAELETMIRRKRRSERKQGK
jgi:BlaI family penicillinase repressor